MKRFIEPTPVYRTVRVYSHDRLSGTVSLSIDEVPMRVSLETFTKLKSKAIRTPGWAQ